MAPSYPDASEYTTVRDRLMMRRGIRDKRRLEFEGAKIYNISHSNSNKTRFPHFGLTFLLFLNLLVPSCAFHHRQSSLLDLPDSETQEFPVNFCCRSNGHDLDTSLRVWDTITGPLARAL